MMRSISILALSIAVAGMFGCSKEDGGGETNTATADPGVKLLALKFHHDS